VNNPEKPGLRYAVQVTKINENIALARRDDHELQVSIKKGDNSQGFNAVETLLAALGTCVLTNINDFSKKLRLKINTAKVKLVAVRSNDPPKVESIQYQLIIQSDEDRNKLEELFHLSQKWGTVTNTLIETVDISGTLVINVLEAEIDENSDLNDAF